MSETVLKRCYSCPEEQQWHPATTEFFHCDKNRKDGLANQCKVCKNARWKVYMSPEVHTQRKIQRKATDQAYRRRPEVRERAKEREMQPEAIERRRAYRLRPEVRARRHRSTAHERARAQKHTYRARKRTILGTHTPEQIQEQLKRQRCRCYYCKTKFEQRYIYHVDHTFPLSRVDGSDIPANDMSYLVLACPTCNERKGNKYPWEFFEGGRLL